LSAVHCAQQAEAPQIRQALPSVTTAEHALLVIGVAHTFGVPPPPQVIGLAHVPHESMPPQPSEIVPQVAPCAAQGVGAQPHVPAALQVCPVGHEPQSSVPPQPSLTGPQVLPSEAQEPGVHPQMPGAPPPPHV
jgi:hypothetical protein